MALKKKITKEEYAKLAEHFKGEYKADGDNFILDVEGEEDTGELRRANERNKAAAKEEKKRADEAQAKLDALGDEGARKAGDIVTLEKSFNEKLKLEIEKRENVINKQKAHIQTQLVDNVAHKLASELSDSPKLLLPHIKARLSADFDGEEPQTRVLDAMGKLSAFTVDDLKKEFSTSKDFSAIIRVSKASGAGGKMTQDQSRPGGLSQFSNEQSKNPAEMSNAELRDRVEARIAANKE